MEMTLEREPIQGELEIRRIMPAAGRLMGWKLKTVIGLGKRK